MVAAGTTYYYTVKAVNVSGSSVASGEANALTYPAAPTGLTKGTVTATSVAMSWTAPSGTVDGYYVYGGTSSGNETLLSGLVTTTSYTDSTASSGTTYYYYVKAVNNTSQSAQYSAASNEINALTIPAAPTGLTATSASASQINLSWSSSVGARELQRLSRHFFRRRELWHGDLLRLQHQLQ